MFSKATYIGRRALLLDRLEEGIIWLPGNRESPMNYPGNPYPFRQDSTFLYYFGLDRPGLDGLIDLDEGQTTLYGHDPDLDEIVWTGPQPSVGARAEQTGVDRHGTPAELAQALQQARRQGRRVHILPPYRAAQTLRLADLLESGPDALDPFISRSLIAAVVDQRATKSPEEILEMDRAVNASGLMHRAAMQATRPGISEARLAGMMEGLAVGQGGRMAYPPIVSVHGHVLHNPHHHNILEAGQLLLADAGAETPRHYAGDITRTWPVSPRFSDRQRDLYQVVLRSQAAALEAIHPGKTYRDIHLTACRSLTEGLQALGLMQGDVDESVAKGAHALFFPHGLGHLIGLDVHDMEGLGEDHVGYDQDVQRSPQFGLHALRLGRKLQPGFTLSVEPGLYFIPPLVQQWEAEQRHSAFIRYDRLAPFMNLGGIRIEDLALVTAEGHRVLGDPIPKEVDQIETLRANSEG